MMRSLIWLAGDTDGWACSNCRWRCPVPTLLSTEEAKSAYDRLAAAKFHEHDCAVDGGTSAAKAEVKRATDSVFVDRTRALIKRGFTPKVAVELVLQEIEMEYGKDPKRMEKARADAEDFLSKARRGLI